METLSVIFIVIFMVIMGTILYQIGKTTERLNTLGRLRAAHRVFYGSRDKVSTPNWRSSSDLMMYIGGAGDLPELTTYEAFRPGAIQITKETHSILGDIDGS